MIVTIIIEKKIFNLNLDFLSKENKVIDRLGFKGNPTQLKLGKGLGFSNESPLDLGSTTNFITLYNKVH